VIIEFEPILTIRPLVATHIKVINLVAFRTNAVDRIGILLLQVLALTKHILPQDPSRTARDQVTIATARRRLSALLPLVALHTRLATPAFV
jgi:hypothetical protein